VAAYPVYLEIGASGVCLAHVVGLAGCVVRAPTREEALRLLPGAIGAYLAWLRSHGEPAPAEAPEIEIAGESAGGGPFDPGDAAALFPPDREILTAEELEKRLRLLTHSRADLLALVSGLSEGALDQIAEPGTLSLRQLLRHVGNAEEWYVSRLVPPEGLPPEWEGDDALPIFEFLGMERRTAVACLRALSGEQRAGVFFPAQWTSHPDEPWTARKVLRRFLEHELEHTAQARDILAPLGRG
jgi:predicted RNase H-like HicB family nuclease/uncharacterized damage-inducible protein DinB